MTLNGVMAVNLRYFSEIGSFRGALRKSSRSLSHLLMSSCKYKARSIIYVGTNMYCSRSEPGIKRVQALADISRSALYCYNNKTSAPIANPPNSAQLGGIPYHSPSYVRVDAVEWEREWESYK